MLVPCFLTASNGTFLFSSSLAISLHVIHTSGTLILSHFLILSQQLLHSPVGILKVKEMVYLFQDPHFFSISSCNAFKAQKFLTPCIFYKSEYLLWHHLLHWVPTNEFTSRNFPQKSHGHFIDGASSFASFPVTINLVLLMVLLLSTHL